MAWTTPGTATAGEVLTASFWNAQVRDNMLEILPNGTTIQTYIPTLSGGWALGNSTYTAKYVRHGRIVHYWSVITIGSTATKGTTMVIAVPVAAVDADNLTTANVMFEDVGSAFNYGFARPSTTTTMVIDCINTATSYAQAVGITSSTPFTWATGDRIWISGTYLAA
jgi:hypothetical protein